MGTKSDRSSGSQFNPRGITQGVTLVDPFTGNPVHVITDGSGIRRLAVDANITAQNITVDVNLDSDNDQVAVEDPDTGAHIRVENDGSINVNASIDAFASTPDSSLAVGTEDSLTTGTKHVLRVDNELDLRVGISDGANKAIVNGSGELATTDADTHTILNSIDAGIPAALGATIVANSMPVTMATDQPPINVNIVNSPSANETIKEIFGSITSIASGIETTIASYTVPALKTAALQRIEFSGTNIAEFKYYKNGVLTGVLRTHHGSGLSGRFEFLGASEEGLPLVATNVIEIKAIHDRPLVGDFQARIQYQEIS